MNAPTTTTPTGRRRAQPRARIANLGVMAVTAVVIFVVAYLANQPAAGSSGGVTPVQVSGGASGKSPTVGEVVPDFKATTDAGKAFQLSLLAGSPVWLSFGASWCQPCRAENPDIQAAWDKHKAQGLALVQVYMSEDAVTVSRYAETVGLTYTRVPDADTRLASIYRIVGIPSHFFIDKTGVLRQLRIGTLDTKAIEAALKEILG